MQKGLSIIYIRLSGSKMKNLKKNWFYLLGTVVLFSVAFIKLYREYIKLPGLVDFAAYCAISRAMFEGVNPFPDHFELLFCRYRWGSTVPIVFPGQWPFFAFFGYMWGNAIQIAYYVLNIAIICFLTAWTLVTQHESPVPQRCQGTLFPGPASRTPGASLQQPGPRLPRAGWLWALKELVAPAG